MKKFRTEIHLNREMTLLDATLIGVGAMIGAGIFVLIGIAAGVAGPALIVAFLLNGVVALFTAMSYAELGSCFHDAGGGYLWVKEGLPKWNGFLSGWMSWFAHSVACGLYALGFGAYFGHLLHEFGVVVPHWGILSPQKVLALIIAVIFAYVNFRGASETGKIGNLITIAKIVILAIFVAFGLEMIFHRGDTKASLTPFMPNGWSGVVKAMGLTFIAFQGFEVISQSSEEIKNPKKNIPRAVFLSLMIVVPIYLLVAVAALGSVAPGGMTPWDYLASQKEIALVEVSRQFFAGGGAMILFGGLISTMSALNATVYSSSRVAFAMGRDRNFPALFSKVHSKNFTPYWGIIASLAIISFMVVALPIEDVASAADIMFLLLFLQVNVALIRLRKKRPDLDRGFVVPLCPWLSIAGIMMLLVIAVFMFGYSYVAWIVTGVWICLGLFIYKGYSSKRESEHIQKVSALASIEKKEYTILVCLSNNDSVQNLTSIAVAIARKHKGSIIFLHIIEVEEGRQLLAGLGRTLSVKPLLEKAESLSEEANIPTRSIIKVAHRISQGILDTAAEENCNFIVMGRQQQPTFFDRVFASLVDTILQKAPAEVGVLHGDIISKEIHQILIPFGTSVHTILAAEMGPALSEYFSAKLRVVGVIDSGLPVTDQDEKADRIKASVRKYLPEAEVEIVLDRNIGNGIARASREADLVVMGGRTGDFLELLLVRSLTQRITEQVRCPVLWLKEYEERKSFWSTIFGQEKGEKNR